MKTALVIGASRGIGLAFARQLSAAGFETWGTCRGPAPAQASGVHWQSLDLDAPASIPTLGADWSRRTLDLLVLNAGITDRPSRLGSLDADAWLETLRINTIAPVKLVEALRPALQRASGAWVLAMSSELASVGTLTTTSGSWAKRGAYYAYRTSKAALNACIRLLALELADDRIWTAAIDPGWVRTDMGGADAPLEATAAVQKVMELHRRLTPADSGGCYRSDGSRIPS